MTQDIREILVSYFGAPVIAFAENAGIQVKVLRVGEKYQDASAELRKLGIDCDSWPVPPAGLFVVAERTVYIKTVTIMTVCHEFGHALDCALGGGTYRSGGDSKIRAAFAHARSFVTPYAACGLDEYFAESMRAYVEANDATCLWPQATRERLLAVDLEMHDIIRDIFAEIAALETKAA